VRRYAARLSPRLLTLPAAGLHAASSPLGMPAASCCPAAASPGVAAGALHAEQHREATLPAALTLAAAASGRACQVGRAPHSLAARRVAASRFDSVRSSESLCKHAPSCASPRL
jgi:hypothetical protein